MRTWANKFLGVNWYCQIPSLISFLSKKPISIIKKLLLTKSRFYNSFFAFKRQEEENNFMSHFYLGSSFTVAHN